MASAAALGAVGRGFKSLYSELSMLSMLSWLHWDPPRFVFDIPFLHLPVAWYGIFFSLGFLLGFFILLPILKQKLLQNNKLSNRDVVNWPDFIFQIKCEMNKKNSPLAYLIRYLSQTTKEAIQKLQLKQEPDLHLKESILAAFNSVSRTQIEKAFPKTIHKIQNLALFLMDKLTWFVVAGTIIGARLGHVLFYDFPRYLSNPIDIIKIWEGGLASHGGAVGVMIALWLYQLTIRKRFPELTFLTLLDLNCIPTALVGMFIRIGNFFNQEITGTPSLVPWAIIFGHPMEGEPYIPRHPAQLYEAAAYFLIFLALLYLWKRKGPAIPQGTLIGLFMTSVFGSRFILEFFKTPQSAVINESFLFTGQYLSIPFIVFGATLLIRNLVKFGVRRQVAF